MKKITPNFYIGISIVVLFLVSIFAVTSNASWIITGPPKSHIVLTVNNFNFEDHNGTTYYPNATIYNLTIGNLYSGKTQDTQNTQTKWESSIFYSPNNVLLLNYSVHSPKLPVLYPTTNNLYINASIWFMAYVFSQQGSSYKFVGAINDSIHLTSTNLSAKGSLLWKPNYATSPSSNFYESDYNYSVGILYFTTFYVENMNSSTFHYEYGTTGLSGYNPNANLPTTPYPSKYPGILNSIDPSLGAIFIYKNWGVVNTILFTIIGLSIASLFILIAIYYKKKNLPLKSKFSKVINPKNETKVSDETFTLIEEIINENKH